MTTSLLSAVLWSTYNLPDSHLRYHAVIETLWDQFDGHDLLPEIGQIAQEARLINGRWDDIVPDEMAEDSWAALGSPEGGLVKIEASGHNPFTEQPEAFGEAVLDFVR